MPIGAQKKRARDQHEDMSSSWEVLLYVEVEEEDRALSLLRGV